MYREVIVSFHLFVTPLLNDSVNRISIRTKLFCTALSFPRPMQFQAICEDLFGFQIGVNHLCTVVLLGGEQMLV